MDTAVLSSRPTESVLTDSGRRQRPGRTEAEAAVRTLIEWAGDDPATRREFLAMIGSPGSGSNGS